MTLATRCPKCGTTFRVVSDQLKLRKGLVKCGKCAHVFNGVEFLHYFSEPTVPEASRSAVAQPLTPPVVPMPAPEFLGSDGARELDQRAPSGVRDLHARPSEPAVTSASAPEPAVPNALASTEPRPPREAGAWTPLTAEPEIAPATHADAYRPAGTHDLGHEEPAQPHGDAFVDIGADAAAPLEPAHVSTHDTAPNDASASDADALRAWASFDADRDVGSVGTDRATSSTPGRREPSLIAASSDDSAALAPLTLFDVARQGGPAVPDTFEELPAFLREKRRAPRWVHVLMQASTIVAAFGLAVQGAYVYRAELATRFPSTRAALETACAALPRAMRCEVGLPRHITQLRVTGADLQALAGGSFNLVVGLHNEGELAQDYPTLDVMLTNVRSQLVVRRAIAPPDYLRTRADAAALLRSGIAAGTEDSVTIPMRINDESVVGYTVGIFYP